MSFTMSYKNTNGLITTVWTSIKLSWVAVSTAFETVNSPFGSYLWAGSVGTSTITGQTGPIMSNSLWSNIPNTVGVTTECGYINASPPYFDTFCASHPKAKFLTHLYIMGFKFNPNGKFSLGASALLNHGTNSITDVDESNSIFKIHIAGTNGIPLTGPQMTLNTFGNQL